MTDSDAPQSAPRCAVVLDAHRHLVLWQQAANNTRRARSPTADAAPGDPAGRVAPRPETGLRAVLAAAEARTRALPAPEAGALWGLPESGGVAAAVARMGPLGRRPAPDAFPTGAEDAAGDSDNDEAAATKSVAGTDRASTIDAARRDKRREERKAKGSKTVASRTATTAGGRGGHHHAVSKVLKASLLRASVDVVTVSDPV